MKKALYLLVALFLATMVFAGNPYYALPKGERSALSGCVDFPCVIEQRTFDGVRFDSFQTQRACREYLYTKHKSAITALYGLNVGKDISPLEFLRERKQLHDEYEEL